MNAGHCHTIWDNTPPNSSLRKWTVDAVVSAIGAETFKKQSASWPADLVLKVAINLMDRQDEYIDDDGLTKRMEGNIEADEEA